MIEQPQEVHCLSYHLCDVFDAFVGHYEQKILITHRFWVAKFEKSHSKIREIFHRRFDKEDELG